MSARSSATCSSDIGFPSSAVDPWTLLIRLRRSSCAFQSGGSRRLMEASFRASMLTRRGSTSGGSIVYSKAKRVQSIIVTSSVAHYLT